MLILERTGSTRKQRSKNSAERENGPRAGINKPATPKTRIGKALKIDLPYLQPLRDKLKCMNGDPTKEKEAQSKVPMTACTGTNKIMSVGAPSAKRLPQANLFDRAAKGLFRDVILTKPMVSQAVSPCELDIAPLDLSSVSKRKTPEPPPPKRKFDDDVCVVGPVTNDAPLDLTVKKPKFDVQADDDVIIVSVQKPAQGQIKAHSGTIPPSQIAQLKHHLNSVPQSCQIHVSYGTQGIPTMGGTVHSARPPLPSGPKANNNYNADRYCPCDRSLQVPPSRFESPLNRANARTSGVIPDAHVVPKTQMPGQISFNSTRPSVATSNGHTCLVRTNAPAGPPHGNSCLCSSLAVCPEQSVCHSELAIAQDMPKPSAIGTTRSRQNTGFNVFTCKAGGKLPPNVSPVRPRMKYTPCGPAVSPTVEPLTLSHNVSVSPAIGRSNTFIKQTSLSANRVSDLPSGREASPTLDILPSSFTTISHSPALLEKLSNNIHIAPSSASAVENETPGSTPSRRTSLTVCATPMCPTSNIDNVTASESAPRTKSLTDDCNSMCSCANSADQENKVGMTHHERTKVEVSMKPSIHTQPLFINIPNIPKESSTTLLHAPKDSSTTCLHTPKDSSSALSHTSKDSLTALIHTPKDLSTTNLHAPQDSPATLETDRVKTILRAKLLPHISEPRSPPRLSVASPPGSVMPQSPLPSPQMPVLSPHRSPVAAVQSPHRSPGHAGVTSLATIHSSASGTETTIKSLTYLHPRIAMSLNSPTASMLSPAVIKERASEIAHQLAHDKYVAHLDINSHGQDNQANQFKHVTSLQSQQKTPVLCANVTPKQEVSEEPETGGVISQKDAVSLKKEDTHACDLELTCDEVPTLPMASPKRQSVECDLESKHQEVPMPPIASDERQGGNREKTVSPTPMADQLVSMVASQSDKVRSIMVQARHCQQNATTVVEDKQDSCSSTPCLGGPQNTTEVAPIEIVPIPNIKVEEEETDVKQLPNIANLAAFVPTSNKNVVPPPLYVSTPSTVTRPPEPIAAVKSRPSVSLKKNSVSSSSSSEHPTLVKQLEGTISGGASSLTSDCGKVVPIANVNPMLLPIATTVQFDQAKHTNGGVVDTIPGILAQGSLSDWQAELANFKKNTLRMPSKLIFVPKATPSSAVDSGSQTFGQSAYARGIGDRMRGCGVRGGRGRGRGKRVMRPTVKNLLAMREGKNQNTVVDVSDTKVHSLKVSSSTSLHSPTTSTTHCAPTSVTNTAVTNTGVLSPKLQSEQKSAIVSSKPGTPILKIPSIKPKLTSPEFTVPPIRLTLKNGSVPSIKIKSTEPLTEQTKAFSAVASSPKPTTSPATNKKTPKKKLKEETAKKSHAKKKASLDTREFSINFVKKFGKKSGKTAFVQSEVSPTITPQAHIVNEEPSVGAESPEKSFKDNWHSNTSCARNSIQTISTDQIENINEENKVNSDDVGTHADCLSAGKPKRIRRLPKKFRTDSPPLPLTPKRTKSSPVSPKSPKSPKSQMHPITRVASTSPKTSTSPNPPVSPRAPISPGSAGKFKIVKDSKQSSPQSNDSPLSPIKLGRICSPPKDKKRFGLGSKKRKGSEGGSPTKKQKTRSRRSLLDELASSDGYVAEKKAGRKSEDLFADPSTLSREERALQRAMIQFTEMEMKESRKVPAERTTASKPKSNTRQKADALMRKAIDRQRSDRAKPEQNLPKYLDFQPEILITRTRNQRAVLNGETPNRTKYHKDTAYEEELKREEQRRNQLREKRKRRLEEERNRVQHENESQEENTFPHPVSEVDNKVERNETSTYEFKENDKDNDGFWEIEPSRANRLRHFDKSGKGRLTMKLHWRPIDAKRRAIKHATARAAKSIKRSTGRVLHHKPWLFRRHGRKRRPPLKTLRRNKANVQQDPVDQEFGSELVQEGVSDNYLPDIDDSVTDEMFQFESDVDQFGELKAEHISGHIEDAKQLSKAKDEPVYDESQIPVPAELKKLAICRDTGETVLHRAARLGYEDIALYCAQTKHVDLNARDNAGYTPLHECCVSDNWEIAGHLLQYGADVNVSSLDGVRPLHDAVENDHTELVRLLLGWGADPLLATYSGRTVDDMAHTDSMKEFLKGHYADLNGPAEGQEDMPWCFEGSSVLEKVTPDIFEGLPKDEEGDDLNSQLEFEFSGTAHLPSFNLSLDSEHGSSNYVLLSDVLEELEMKRHVFFSIHGNLTIRSVPVDSIVPQITQSQINNSGSWILCLKNSRQQCVELVKLDDQLRHILAITVETPFKCLISRDASDDAQEFLQVDEEKRGEVIEISDSECDSLYKEIHNPADDANQLNVTIEQIDVSSDALPDGLYKKEDEPEGISLLSEALEEGETCSETKTGNFSEKGDTTAEETVPLNGAVEQMDTSFDTMSDNLNVVKDSPQGTVASHLSVFLKHRDVTADTGTNENPEVAREQTTETEINRRQADKSFDSPGSIELCRNDDDSGNSSSSTCAYSEGELDECTETDVLCHSDNFDINHLPNQKLDLNNAHDGSLCVRTRKTGMRKKRRSKCKQSDSAENMLNSGVLRAYLKNVTEVTAGEKAPEGVVSHDGACNVVDSGTEEDKLQTRGQSEQCKPHVERTDNQIAVVPGIQSGYRDAFELDAVALAMREAGLVDSDNSMDAVVGTQGGGAYETSGLIMDSQPQGNYTMKVATTPEECFINENMATTNMLNTAAYVNEEPTLESPVKTDALCNIKIAEVCSLRECSENIQSASPEFLPQDDSSDLHTIEKYDDQTVPDDGQ